MSSIMLGTPRHPTSSSYDSARWIGLDRFAAFALGSIERTAATKPFMSHVPRP